MPDNVAIFIDAAYLQRLLRDEFSRANINFAALASVMSGPDKLLRAYYYHCPPYQSSSPSSEERTRYAAWERFQRSLNMTPRFKVRLGKLEYRGNNPDGSPRFEQKRVDILLSLDLVQHAIKGHIGRAALLAGDSDFIPAVSAAQSEGVVISLFHGESVHTELLQEVDERLRIDQTLIDSIRL